MGERRGRLRRWFRVDPDRVMGPREMVRVLRHRPQLLLRFGISLVITHGVLVGLLALLGRLDDFGAWGYVPVLLSASVFGSELHEWREVLRDSESEA